MNHSKTKSYKFRLFWRFSSRYRQIWIPFWDFLTRWIWLFIFEDQWAEKNFKLIGGQKNWALIECWDKSQINKHKYVFQPNFWCVQHLKAGPNTQHTRIFQQWFYLGLQKPTNKPNTNKSFQLFTCNCTFVPSFSI